jgi:primosomal protein N' (replication factor Y)
VANRQFPQQCDVLIPVAIDQAYTYRVPDTLNVVEGAYVRVPLGTREVIGVVWNTGGQTERTNARLKDIKHVLPVPPLKKTFRTFIDRVADYTLAPHGNVLALVVRPPDEERPVQARIGVRATHLIPQRMTPARQKVLSILQNHSAISKTTLAHDAGVSVSVINGLIDEGVLETIACPVEPLVRALDADYSTPELSPDQREAAHRLCQSVKSYKFSVTLLEGVTGSGKTETYCEAIAQTLRQGRQVLVLMPEIALTTPFISRFAVRFGANPALWHSGLSERQRQAFASAIGAGDASVVIGARSALFLPFPNLGLIIVDEEHESAYKQEDGVLYHARDMAVMRAHIEQIPVILASATPSLETQVNVIKGKYNKVTLPNRFGASVMPDIHLIDLRAHPLPANHWISAPLKEAITDTLHRKEQALLFLNRRGYAPLTVCRACGHRYQCSQCSAWLVDHRARRALMCHQCGHTEQRPQACTECGTVDALISCGPGVERLAEEAQAHFPQARTLVLSSDIAGGQARLQRELDAVTRGDVDLIIGTQLVAKGHHFPHITCVGVVDADVGLMSADPRASERTFQMLQQVTGRAGRGDKAGRAYIQTYQPHHPLMSALVQNDVALFYEQEITSRENAALPPFGRLAGVIISGTDQRATEHFARQFALAAPRIAGVILLGPAEAPITLIRGRYRFRLLVKTPRLFPLQSMMRDWLKCAPRPHGHIKITVDIDPYSFM